LGDALSERDRDRIRMKAVSLEPCAFGTDMAFRGTAIPAPPKAKFVNMGVRSSFQFRNEGFFR
jgi:hypothetical protein